MISLSKRRSRRLRKNLRIAEFQELGFEIEVDYSQAPDSEDVEQLNAGLKHYIDYYNRHRIKMKLGGMSPVEYRLQAA